MHNTVYPKFYCIAYGSIKYERIKNNKEVPKLKKKVARANYFARHSGFSVAKVQNTKNIVAVDNATHTQISRFYASKFRDVSQYRIFLKGGSFKYQFKMGIEHFMRFGGIL